MTDRQMLDSLIMHLVNHGIMSRGAIAKKLDLSYAEFAAKFKILETLFLNYNWDNIVTSEEMIIAGDIIYKISKNQKNKENRELARRLIYELKQLIEGDSE